MSKPECDQYLLPGVPPRYYDLCACVDRSGIGKPTLNQSNAWRRGQSLPPLSDSPADQNIHARGGSVRIGGGVTKADTAAKPWDVSQPPRGLGDVIAKVTHATGLDKAVEFVAKKLGKKSGCGCKGRQKKLNELVPFKSKGN